MLIKSNVILKMWKSGRDIQDSRGHPRQSGTGETRRKAGQPRRRIGRDGQDGQDERDRTNGTDGTDETDGGRDGQDERDQRRAQPGIVDDSLLSVPPVPSPPRPVVCPVLRLAYPVRPACPACLPDHYDWCAHIEFFRTPFFGILSAWFPILRSLLSAADIPAPKLLS